jgi:hypothetical protein
MANMKALFKNLLQNFEEKRLKPFLFSRKKHANFGTNRCIVSQIVSNTNIAIVTIAHNNLNRGYDRVSVCLFVPF